MITPVFPLMVRTVMLWICNWAVSTCFGAGYILDVNRHLNPKYGIAADSLWDFKVNHWELDAPDVLGVRHPLQQAQFLTSFK